MGDEGIMVMAVVVVAVKNIMMRKPSLIGTGKKVVALEMGRRWLYHHDHGTKQH